MVVSAWVSYVNLYADYSVEAHKAATVAALSADIKPHGLTVFLCVPTDGDTVDGVVLVSTGDSYINLSLPGVPDTLTSIGFFSAASSNSSKTGCDGDPRLQALIAQINDHQQLLAEQDSNLKAARAFTGICPFRPYFSEVTSSSCPNPCSFASDYLATKIASSCLAPCGSALRSPCPSTTCVYSRYALKACATPSHAPTASLIPASASQQGSSSDDVGRAKLLGFPYPIPPEADARMRLVPMAFEWVNAVQSVNWSERYLRLDFNSPRVCAQAQNEANCRPQSLGYESPVNVFVYMPSNAIPLNPPSSLVISSGEVPGVRVLASGALSDGANVEIHWLSQKQLNLRDLWILGLGVLLGVLGGIFGNLAFDDPRWLK